MRFWGIVRGFKGDRISPASEGQQGGERGSSNNSTLQMTKMSSFCMDKNVIFFAPEDRLFRHKMASFLCCFHAGCTGERTDSPGPENTGLRRMSIALSSMNGRAVS